MTIQQLLNLLKTSEKHPDKKVIFDIDGCKFEIEAAGVKVGENKITIVGNTKGEWSLDLVRNITSED